MESVTEAYVGQIEALLSVHANAAEAAAMKRYMRHQFEFVGIRSPLQKQLNKQLFQANTRLSHHQLSAAIVVAQPY